MPPIPEPASRNGTLFPATMWSALLAAQGEQGAEALQGLERLARAYWRPLYVFARQRGAGHEEAADGVQGFFEYLLSGEVLRKVKPGEGRFRNFLLVVFRRWLDDGMEKRLAAKRGGGALHLSLDELNAAALEPVAGRDSPEEAFDRKWAFALVGRALLALQEAWAARAAVFQALKCGLDGSDEVEPYAAIAARLGITEGAVKTAAYDLRKGFGNAVRREIRSTVASDEDVEQELRYLVQLIQR